MESTMTTHVQVSADAAEGITDGDRRRRRRAALIAAGAAIAVGVTGGIGYAVWLASGSGPGAAQATSAQALSVVAGTVPASAHLYPGATRDVVFDVTNPNPYNVQVTSATLSTVTGVGGCPAGEFTVNPGSVTPVTINASSTQTVTVTGGLTMKLSAPDGCQGVTVTVSGTVSGTQV
jgi:hypothetical protein